MANFKAQSEYEDGGAEKHDRNLHQDSWSPGRFYMWDFQIESQDNWYWSILCSMSEELYTNTEQINNALTEITIFHCIQKNITQYHCYEILFC